MLLGARKDGEFHRLQSHQGREGKGCGIKSFLFQNGSKTFSKAVKAVITHELILMSFRNAKEVSDFRGMNSENVSGKGP